MKSLLSLTRFTKFWSAVAFVTLSAFIMMVGSEKVYWYIQGIGQAGDLATLVLVYMIPTLVGLWFVARGGTALPGLVLAGATFGWIVEGVITTELYGDGPIGPFFPSYFAGWHGLLSLVTLWYLFRKWAVAGDRRKLGRAAAVIGLFWGWWSVSYWLPDAIDDPDLLENGFDVGIWAVDKFAIYAFLVGGGLMLAHWLIGFVWPERWASTRRWTAISIGLIVLSSLPVLMAVPWGAFKLGALLGLVWWANRRRSSHEASVFGTLAGRPSIPDVAPILLMPAMAVLTYGIAFVIRPNDNFIRIFSYWSTTMIVAAGGLVGAIWAFRSRRNALSAALNSIVDDHDADEPSADVNAPLTSIE
jgi:hypothetical protein